RRTALKVKEAVEGDPLCPACVFLAPPDHHLIVTANGVLGLSKAPRVHYVRPSVEPLFESVATTFRHRVIAVVLTGGGEDGSQGVRVIKQKGGTVIAQDEETSKDFGMPSAAIQTG